MKAKLFTYFLNSWRYPFRISIIQKILLFWKITSFECWLVEFSYFFIRPKSHLFWHWCGGKMVSFWIGSTLCSSGQIREKLSKDFCWFFNLGFEGWIIMNFIFSSHCLSQPIKPHQFFLSKGLTIQVDPLQKNKISMLQLYQLSIHAILTLNIAKMYGGNSNSPRCNPDSARK